MFLIGLSNKLPGKSGTMGEACQETLQGVGPDQKLINPLSVFVAQEKKLLEQLWNIVAIDLQKKLMNFTTNQANTDEMDKQIEALGKALRYFGDTI